MIKKISKILVILFVGFMLGLFVNNICDFFESKFDADFDLKGLPTSSLLNISFPAEFKINHFNSDPLYIEAANGDKSITVLEGSYNSYIDIFCNKKPADFEKEYGHIKYGVYQLKLQTLYRPAGTSCLIIFSNACDENIVWATLSSVQLKKIDEITANKSLRIGPNFKYSFERDEYVNPLIVQELCGSLADKHQSVISVDLLTGNKSNRFYSDTKIKMLNGEKWVWHDNEDGGYFAYRYIGESPSGVNILHCIDSSGGSGVFHSLIFLTFSRDDITSEKTSNTSELASRRRLLLNTQGNIGLGDRYEGKITYDGTKLIIGADTSPQKYGNRLKPQEIIIR